MKKNNGNIITNEPKNRCTCPECVEKARPIEKGSIFGTILEKKADDSTYVIAAFTILYIIVCYAFTAAKLDIALARTHLRAGLLNTLATEGFLGDDLENFIEEASAEFSNDLYDFLFKAPDHHLDSKEDILDIVCEIATVSYYHAKELINTYPMPNQEPLLPEEKFLTQERGVFAAREVIELMECEVKPSIYYEAQGVWAAAFSLVDRILAYTGDAKLEFVDVIDSDSEDNLEQKYSCTSKVNQ